MPSSKASFESLLESEGELTYTSEGYSMYPLISNGGDVLRIVKLDRPIKRGDVLLYKDSKGHYILHRLIKIRKNGILVLAGDNNSWKDEPIKKESVLGRLRCIYKKDGSSIDLDRDKKFHSFCCVHFFYLKALLLKSKRCIRKTFKK